MRRKHFNRTINIRAKIIIDKMADAVSIRVSLLTLRMFMMQGRTIGTNCEFKNIKPKFQIKCLLKNSESLIITLKRIFSKLIIISKK